MKTIKDIERITIHARRWFQRTYGNTYHRSIVCVYYHGGECDHIDSGTHYGYGEGYDQTALEIFCKHFKIERTRNDPAYLSRYARDRKISVDVFLSDVPRQKDL